MRSFFTINGKVKRAFAVMLTASMLLSTNVAEVFAEEAYTEGLAEAIEEAAVGEAVTTESPENMTEESVVGEGENAAAATPSANEIITPLNATPSANEIYEPECTLPAVNALKAVLTKKNQVKLTWKKVKGAKSYRIYRMMANGVAEAEPLAQVRKVNYVDKMIESAETYAYRVIPVNAAGQGGYAEYCVATPIITKVARTGTGVTIENESDEDRMRRVNDVAFDVDLTTIKGATNYTLYNGLKKRKPKLYTASVTVSNTNGIQAEPYTVGKLLKPASGVPVPMEKAYDNENIMTSRWYYYSARASFEVAGVKQVYSDYSNVVKGRITTRAPQNFKVSALTGTSVYLEWEDLENATDIQGNKILSSQDFYRIMYSTNGGKSYKKYKDLRVLDADQNVVTKKKHFTAAEAVEQGIGTTEGDYDVNVVSACYKVTKLTPEKNYVFKLAGVKNKVEGEFTNACEVRTNLNRITELKVANTNRDNATLEWPEVEGATGYRVFFTGELTKAQAEGDLSKLPYDRIDVKKITYKVLDKDEDTTGMDTENIVTYTVNNLENMQYYAFHVTPLYKKHASENDTSNYVSAQVRIAAPDVKVTQNGTSLHFKWEKIPRATGYRIEYVTGTNDLSIFSTAMRTYQEEKSASTTDFTISNLTMGTPVAVRITTLRTTNDHPDSKSDEATGNCYEAVEYLAPPTPKVTNVLYNGDGKGADLWLGYGAGTVSAVNNFANGYQVWASEEAKKGYTLLAEVTNTDRQYKDNSPLTNGKKRYYRIYQIMQGNNESNSTWKAVSRKYVQTEFCNPTSVADATINMKAGETKKYTLSFKPSKATTMKQVSSYYVSDEATPGREEFTTGVTSNKYIKLKLSEYGEGESRISEYYSPEITIEGKGKNGTTYIQATLANGSTVILKVVLGDGSGNANKDDDEKKGSDGAGQIIVLDPGHGGSDGGCSSGSLKESEINLKISKYTRDYLEKAGFKVYLTRNSDEYVDLEKRVQIAKGYNAKAIISQHINSGTGKGVECYYSIDGTGKSLASKMCSMTAKATKMSNRGAKSKESESNNGKDYYAIIRYARSSADGGAITGLIMENGFIQSDSAFMDSDDKLKEIAKANANAIIEYYGK